VAKLSPISTEMARLMDDGAEIDKLLAKGALQAREITAPILKKTYEIVGMVG
jgi:tryptophanyl-tRNA synthetase